ncbi:MAG: hypothetical protein AAGD96_06715 [Chloroflexota bacterium]
MSDQNPTQSSNQETAIPGDRSTMDRLRDLLLEKERAKVESLQSEVENLEVEISRLKDELDQAKNAVVPTVTTNMGEITHDAVETQRYEMAEALGPIIGEATRYQIKNSRDDMVEALYPIVGDAVARAVGEALNDLRERIDRQIRPNRVNVEQTIIDRMRGIDPAERALRSALPFEINQIFLIQHESGLVLEFVNQESDELTDSDLISGMLTAIRSFVNDSFNAGEEPEDLSEIQYGDESVIIESGTEAYIAAVISGIEPEGFRALLRTLVNELHIQYRQELAEYEGDKTTLPDLITPINSFVSEVSSDSLPESPINLSNERAKQSFRRLGVVLAILLLGACLFYGWLTYRLVPYALGARDTVVPTAQVISLVITATPTETQPPTETPTPEPTSTAVVIVITNTPEPTSTSEPTATATASATQPVPTSTPQRSLQLPNPVWSRQYPDADAPEYIAIPDGTSTTILRTFDDWIEIAWEDSFRGDVTGWIRTDWVNE